MPSLALTLVSSTTAPPLGVYDSRSGVPTTSTRLRRAPDTASYSTTAAVEAVSRRWRVGCQASSSAPLAVTPCASEDVHSHLSAFIVASARRSPRHSSAHRQRSVDRGRRLQMNCVRKQPLIGRRSLLGGLGPQSGPHSLV